MKAKIINNKKLNNRLITHNQWSHMWEVYTDTKPCRDL